jgi:hypothetical protein
MTHKYKCDMCKGEFESDRPQEEALAELKRDFGDVSTEQCDQVCDDCYQQVSPENNRGYYESYLASLN